MTEFDHELDRLSRSGPNAAPHEHAHDAAIVVHELLGLARASLRSHFGSTAAPADAIALVGCMLVRIEQLSADGHEHGDADT